jgi:hypothetical protein
MIMPINLANKTQNDQHDVRLMANNDPFNQASSLLTMQPPGARINESAAKN